MSEPNRDPDSAAKKFCLLSEVARLLADAHNRGQRCESTIESLLRVRDGEPKTMTLDEIREEFLLAKTQADIPVFTDGCVIHIVIHPPQMHSSR
jgi:hypothetical protein